jgi:hypothetical protein
VREAIRIERFKEAGVYDPEFLARERFPFNARGLAGANIANALSQAAAVQQKATIGVDFEIRVEPSFEQMQAEALQAQEKYYEPRKD